jgi:hypothetical protein
MINRCIVLLATLGLASAVPASLPNATSSADLASLWTIADPNLAAANKSFTFIYGGINLAHDVTGGGVAATWYDSGCKEGGSIEYLKNTGGVSTKDTSLTADLYTVDFFDRGSKLFPDPASLDVELAFTTIPKEVAKIDDLYSTADGVNVMMYCVRFGLLAGTTEINFLETLVNITISLTGDFVTESLIVEPKAKTNTTSEINYNVFAQLCGGSSPFNQGAVISVCVFPKDDGAQADGIVMKSVDTFKWIRKGVADTAVKDDITQVAISTPNTPENALTFVDLAMAEDPAGNSDYNYAHIKVSSVLYASYYAENGQVTAEGSATMKFPEVPTARRLGAYNNVGRRLEDEGIPPSPFDVDAGVIAATDGPNMLETASGPTQSYGFAATIVGLVSAVLLA